MMDALFNMPHKRTPVEQERWNRIKVAVCAYAYEIESDSLISDAEYDELARSIKPNIHTGHATLDKFFKEEFSADTGMWVRNHPEIEKLKIYYLSIKAQNPDWVKKHEAGQL